MREEKKRTSRKNKRSKMPFSVRFGILVAVLVMIVVAAGVLMAPGFKVSEVYCEGNTILKSEEIYSLAEISGEKNIFLVGLGKAERNVKKHPAVKDVNIKRVFPNKICISVEERLPLAYVMTGGECAVIDEEYFVMKKEDVNMTSQLIKERMPAFEKKDEAEEKTEKNDEEKQTEEEKQSPEGETETTENGYEFFSIPLVEGIEIKNAEENKKVKSEDQQKLDDTIKLCVALNDAELLNRTTYINVTDMQNVNVVIENRLDVRLGNLNNIEYRAKFLSEVVTTKISAYEVLILDYTGDDIYARFHDDGKERIVAEEEPEETSDDAESTEDKTTDEDKEDSTEETSESDSTDENEEDEEPERKSTVGSL